MDQQNQRIFSLLEGLRDGQDGLRDEIEELREGQDKIIEKLKSMEEGIEAQGKNILIGDEVRALDSRHSELEISHVDRKVEARAEHCTGEATVATDENAVAAIEDSGKGKRTYAIVPSIIEDETFAEPREDSPGHTSEPDRSPTTSVADRILSHDESEFESSVTAFDSRFDMSAFPTAPEALAEVPIEAGIDLTASVSDTIAPRIETKAEPGISPLSEDMNATLHIAKSGEVKNASQADFAEPRISLLPARNYRLLEMTPRGTHRIPDTSTTSKSSICFRYKRTPLWRTANGYCYVRLWDPGGKQSQDTRILGAYQSTSVKKKATCFRFHTRLYTAAGTSR